MKVRPGTSGSKACSLLVALLLPELAPAARQQAPSPASNRLVTGKLIYVAPMPANLDSWLQEDLRVWGKYRVTSNPEGADLEISAEAPDQQPRYSERHGVPLPKKESAKKPQETSIAVVDWVSGERLWSAAILDKKPDQSKTNQPAPSASIEIQARGVTPDQLALKITGDLRRYVEHLESAAGH